MLGERPGSACQAAGLIEARAHCREVLKDEHGRMCIWGAINTAVYGNPCRATQETQDMLKPLSPLLKGLHPVTWNNMPHRKQEHVVKLLRKAADKVRRG